MDTLTAFANLLATPPGNAKVFDWNKAAQIIVNRQPAEASAGLKDDHEWTGGCIYRDGKPVLDSYVYLRSDWCEAELIVDGDYINCWVPSSEYPDWHEHTVWPESALAILNASVIDAESTVIADVLALPEAP